ncbi:hypothetical protein B0J11DRAFT_602274 [Dendryphion nanum]|uniref:Uncharacterized protein n=1 Tax=Dendryphion nanum TaxID=256645 RepID=A0A9P9IT08_9PLEO|nr:hypothetical protein B0J11DRAFT_602274 [Dendryphion nanum]
MPVITPSIVAKIHQLEELPCQGFTQPVQRAWGWWPVQKPSQKSRPAYVTEVVARMDDLGQFKDTFNMDTNAFHLQNRSPFWVPYTTSNWIVPICTVERKKKIEILLNNFREKYEECCKYSIKYVKKYNYHHKQEWEKAEKAGILSTFSFHQDLVTKNLCISQQTAEGSMEQAYLGLHRCLDGFGFEDQQNQGGRSGSDKNRKDWGWILEEVRKCDFLRAEYEMRVKRPSGAFWNSMECCYGVFPDYRPQGTEKKITRWRWQLPWPCPWPQWT